MLVDITGDYSIEPRFLPPPMDDRKYLFFLQKTLLKLLGIVHVSVWGTIQDEVPINFLFAVHDNLKNTFVPRWTGCDGLLHNYNDRSILISFSKRPFQSMHCRCEAYIHFIAKKKRRTKKALSYCYEISSAKIFGPNMQMIKIWCPMNE